MAKDYGMLVAQKGYDGKTCADRFLVYSSAFPTLKIFNVYSVSATIPSSGTTTITITHNLGSYRPYMVISNGEGNDKAYFQTYQGTSQIIDRQYANSLQIDVRSFSGTPGNTIYFTVYIFLDDFSAVAEKTINSGVTELSSSVDYGARISKEGFDVKSCDDKDCILSSSFFNQIIHKKGIATADVSHNLGYVPGSLVFGKNTAESYIQTIKYIQDGTLDDSYLYFWGFFDAIYYIIFKDKVL